MDIKPLSTPPDENIKSDSSESDVVKSPTLENLTTSGPAVETPLGTENTESVIDDRVDNTSEPSTIDFDLDKSTEITQSPLSPSPDNQFSDDNPTTDEESNTDIPVVSEPTIDEPTISGETTEIPESSKIETPEQSSQTDFDTSDKLDPSKLKELLGDVDEAEQNSDFSNPESDQSVTNSESPEPGSTNEENSEEITNSINISNDTVTKLDTDAIETIANDSKGSFKRVLISAVIIVTLFGAAFVGIIIKENSDKSLGLKTSDSFYQNINSNSLDNAYNLGSDEFKKSITVDKFKTSIETLMAENALRGTKTLVSKNFQQIDDEKYNSYIYELKDGSKTSYLKIVTFTKNDQTKILNFKASSNRPNSDIE